MAKEKVEVPEEAVDTPSKAELRKIIEAYKKEKPDRYEARKEAIEAKLAKAK